MIFPRSLLMFSRRLAALLLLAATGTLPATAQTHPLPGASANPALSAASGLAQPPADVSRHEPIFGLGPRTIWAGGFGFEIGLDRDKARLEESWGLGYHALYGLTPNWSVTAEVHQVIDQDEEGEAAETGFGDLTLRTKYRFYRHDVPGGVFHSAVLSGIEVPTGASGVSSESTDFFAGLSGAYEGRRWLGFLTGRYHVNTGGPGGVERGNVFLYDVAGGLRPVLTGYYQPDVVLMAELNGQLFAARSRNGVEIPGTAGSRLLAGLGAWLTYRNWAVKPGVQLPLYNEVRGGDLDYRFVFAVEFHI